ncbi:hypothetical protein V496_08490 [Pseudogymnoascus sp. VKM F-4515 (FW-2607)]|nr:hypothetical protein V496_08490 [Pseudogymnoascus sp. VKM F-4515 (FW-2607)]KFY97884.1 hypothetical protein V498_01817 [Pseudogymnoascus sp. VKM F-4517 (FW-2822)]
MAGSLFSVELNTEEHAIAFYDNLNVYQTPHFRAPLALAYMRRSFTLRSWKILDTVTWVRIEVGLEDIELLLTDFKVASEAAGAIEEVKEEYRARNGRHVQRMVS